LGILAVTTLATALTTGGAIFLLVQTTRDVPRVNEPADALQRYVERNADALLSGDPQARQDFRERARAARGVEYAVLDARGQPIFSGTPGFSRPVPVQRLAGRLNEPRTDDWRVTEATALVRDGEVGGYLLLRYPTLDNPALSTLQRVSFLALLSVAVLAPVVALSGSTLFFARRLGRRFGGPLGELTVAVEKIRSRDLDFAVGYDGQDELGDLCRAMEDLRSELRDTLEREWRRGEEARETVAALSHDLRTPVTVIKGHVESLARAPEGRRPERLERYLPVLEASSDRLVRLLDDVLQVLGMEQSGFELQPQGVDLSDLLHRKSEIYRLRAAERGVSFRLDGGEGPLAVLLDPHRFEQVLDNLFENALRFTPEGGEILLRCKRDGDRLSVALRDTGPGVDPSDLPRVFEKFYRGDRDGAGPKGSAGLGLYVSKLLVEAQGGDISIRNHPDGGCEATFRLPWRRAPAVAPGSARSRPVG
jgi:signal transduction histidine kinase